MATPTTREFLTLKQPRGKPTDPATIQALGDHIGELQLLLMRMQQDVDTTAGRRGPVAVDVTFPVRTVTTPYRVTDQDFLIVAANTAGSITLYLPAAGGAVTGRLHAFKRTQTQSVVITPNGAELIDGAVSLTLTARYQSILLQSDGTGWHILSSRGGDVPIGGIIVWSGAILDIPTDYALCDGVANAPGPDLRDRFVPGAGGAYAVGATGGGTTHTHAGHANHVVTQPSAHAAHIVTQPSDHAAHASAGAHTHDAHTTAADTDVTGAGTRLTGPVTHSSDGGHTHDAHSAHTGTAVDVHSAHTGAAVDAHSAHDSPDHRPLFFALAYIQRMS